MVLFFWGLTRLHVACCEVREAWSDDMDLVPGWTNVLEWINDVLEHATRERSLAR